MKLPSYRYLLAFGLGAAVAVGILSFGTHYAFCQAHYDLLSPAKRCSDGFAQGEWNYEPLREALALKKEELKASGSVTHLSMYVQDLDHGPRFGIGEYDQFYPASLLKFPTLIFFLHIADLDPSILDKKLTLTGDPGVVDNVFSAAESVEVGAPYTIRELLKKMIVFSDNRSFVMLVEEMKFLSENNVYVTFRDLDISEMTGGAETNYVTISPYAKLFAVLYNTGYLSREMSQYGLELLSETTFQGGIAAALPDNVRVAHKFGYTEVNGENQLHDCGIVYHPKTAYILCILSSGPDKNKLNAAIMDISGMVYDAVSSLDLNARHDSFILKKN
jgi:hypothetical protein